MIPSNWATNQNFLSPNQLTHSKPANNSKNNSHENQNKKFSPGHSNQIIQEHNEK
jgi:hypothetical protein